MEKEKMRQTVAKTQVKDSTVKEMASISQSGDAEFLKWYENEQNKK